MTQKQQQRFSWPLIVGAALAGLVLSIFVIAADYIGLCLLLLAAVLTVENLLTVLRAKRPRPARLLTRLLHIGLILAAVWFVLAETYVITGAQTDAGAQTRYLVVLGTQVQKTTPSRALRDRLDAAREFLLENDAAICIVSGSRGPGEDVTEAQCMYEYLVADGIDPDRIWLEDRSHNTAQNIANSAALIEEKTGQAPQRITILTSEYHLRRAKLVAQRQGLSADGVAARTSLLYSKINYFIREAVGVSYYKLRWLFGK